MIATAVFLTMLIQASSQPVYSLLGEVKASDQREAWEECRYQLEKVDLPPDKKASLACIEVVLHDSSGKRTQQHLEYEKGRKMGHTTSLILK